MHSWAPAPPPDRSAITHFVSPKLCPLREAVVPTSLDQNSFFFFFFQTSSENLFSPAIFSFFDIYC